MKKLIDDIDMIPFSQQVDKTRVPQANDFIIEQHMPTLFDWPYHHHTSVEINFLQDCALTYSFSGAPVALRPDRLTLFWGAAPHRVTEVQDQGKITNIYLSLGQFVRWGLPKELVDFILAGGVICTKSDSHWDVSFMQRLYDERERKSIAWRRMHLAEIETRLRRMALEGWEVLLKPNTAPLEIKPSTQAMLHVEAMLRFIAENYTVPISVKDIANAANLSQSRAGALFKSMMGFTIKQQLQRTRLSHARMQLTESDDKITVVALESGFDSLSVFYETFTAANGMTPAKYRAQARLGTPFLGQGNQ